MIILYKNNTNKQTNKKNKTNKNPTKNHQLGGLKQRIPIFIPNNNHKNNKVVISNVLAGDYDVVKAGDGVEAIEMLVDKSQPFPDLILMDNMMPRMNGHDACRKIRYFLWLFHCLLLLLLFDVVVS